MGALLNTTTKMIDLSRANQQDVLAVRQALEQHEKRKSEAVEEMLRQVFAFEPRYHRFNIPGLALDEIARTISNLQIKFDLAETRLPMEAWLIMGYYFTIRKSDNKKAIEELTKIVNNKDSSADLLEKAYFNRGINQVNLGNYDAALKDFSSAMQKNSGNCAYRHYYVDTKLLKMRSDRQIVDNSRVNELVGEFAELHHRLQQEEYEAHPLGRQTLRMRFCRSYASLLIFDAKEYAKAQAVLRDLPESDASLLFLGLVLDAKTNKPLIEEEIARCLTLTRDELERSIEGRSRILRGMILAQCYAWLGNRNSMESEKSALRGEIDRLKREIGPLVSVFSPISQKNESLNLILEQINGIACRT